jgi:carboxymethylenebutenolidase
MIDKLVDIATSAGRMDAFVAHPEGAPRPAVVVYMDIWGLREELFSIARDVARAGYYCIVPNSYYRQGRVRFEYRDEQGRMRSLDALAAEVQETVLTPMRALTDAMVMADVRAILDFLAREPVLHGAKGVLGYCMGGRHALLVAGRYPEEFRAAASLHGTRLISDAADSTHRLADRFKGEIYCGFAERDPHAPPATIATLAQALADRANVRYHFQVHPGTDHGYALPDRDIHDRAATARDWQNIFAMFERELAPVALDRSTA